MIKSNCETHGLHPTTASAAKLQASALEDEQLRTATEL